MAFKYHWKEIFCIHAVAYEVKLRPIPEGKYLGGGQFIMESVNKSMGEVVDIKCFVDCTLGNPRTDLKLGAESQRMSAKSWFFI